MNCVHRGGAAGLALSCLLLLGGTAPASQPSASAVETCPAPPAAAGATDSRLYFITTRLANCSARPVKFGTARGATNLGRFETARPDGPGRPRALRPIVQTEADWIDGLRSDLASTGGRVLIFVHGYNNSFDDAVVRAQLIRRQSTFAGPMLVFSWPSENCLLCYARDEENALWTQPYFDRLLNLLLQEPAVGEIILIAHSMGNRIVLRSIAEADRSAAAASRAKVRTIVLASPDVDRAIVERDFVSALDQPGRRTTVYASRVDNALRASWKLHGYARAGHTACRNFDTGTDPSRPRCVLALRAGGTVALVDTSGVSVGSGHGDFVESRAAAADLCRILEGRHIFPGRVAMAPAHPNAFFLTRDALSPADCPR